MGTIRKENNTGRAVAAIGGGALLLWLVAGGGRGSGVGRGGTAVRTVEALPPTEVRVRIRSGDRVEVDGVSLNLSAAVARARAAGIARVVPSGDARQGWVVDVLQALGAAGVVVYTSMRNGAAALRPRAKLPRYDARKGWTGGDSRTLYAFTDPATARVAVR